MRPLIRGGMPVLILVAVPLVLLVLVKPGSTESRSGRGDTASSNAPLEDIGADGAKLTDRRSPLIEWLDSAKSPIREKSLDSGDITPATSELSTEEESRLRDLCSRRLARCLPTTTTNNNNNNNILYGQLKPTSGDGGAAQGKVCGSDGLLYSSLCQLKWLACLQPTRHLFRRPASFCDSASPKPASSHDNHTRLTSDAGERIPPASWERLPLSALPEGGAPLPAPHFIPLKGGCDRTQYERMKWILWQDFKSSSEALFTHLDSNQNSLIEAHELWPTEPRAATTSSPAQVYVQLREDARHEDCQDEPEAGELESSASASEPSRCWIRLDPAFEPQYPPNPCSLSHLMLYELSEGSSNFTRASFAKVFRRMEGPRVVAGAGGNSSSSVMKMTSRLMVRLGESASLKCSPPGSWWAHTGFPAQDNGIAWGDYEEEEEQQQQQDVEKEETAPSCTWSRHGSDLASNQGPHLSIRVAPRDPPSIGAEPSAKDARIHNHGLAGSVLEVSDAQLYLSGQYKCTCRPPSEWPDAGLFEHWFNLQVSVEPVVRVMPRWQWSLPGSRASFECQYDYIDTESRAANLSDSMGAEISRRPANADEVAQEGQFGLRVGWLRLAGKLGRAIKGSAVSLASSKLTLENLSQLDSGRYACRVERLDKSNNGAANQLSGSAEASLLVRDRPLKSQVQPDTMEQADLKEAARQPAATHLWMFHEAGISIYRLHTDNGGQEIELVSEINGQSPVDARVDGNWNQLTLCGGLNPEQVVICEWSDNALHIDVEQQHQAANGHKYIYVGQPNLNRVLVMDGQKIEIVAIVNTQPQPRKLYLYQPSRIHLSKWLRRRLGREAREKHAQHHHGHSASSTASDSQPASAAPAAKSDSLSQSGARTAFTGSRQLLDTRRAGGESHQVAHEHEHEQQHQHQSDPTQAPGPSRKQPTLIQHDIWLLCYGQPLIVDPSGDEHLEEDQGLFYSASGGLGGGPSGSESSLSSQASAANSAYKQQAPNQNVINTVQPFSPRLYSGGISGLPFGGQFASSMWAHQSGASSGAPNNKDPTPQLLRNRKSVHIIQSTFFSHQQYMQPSNHSLLEDFKRSSMFTKHHIHYHHRHKLPARQTLKYLTSRPQQDLIRDLYVQQKLPWLATDPKYKVHFAYVTHYNDRRLFRVSMDDYRYDSEIDLEHCDPINLIATAQGLLVVQCRSAPNPISSSWSPSAASMPLMGQLVLDQLTNARVQFNSNVQAQESYLTPDSRYLISIFTNSTDSTTGRSRRATPRHQVEQPAVTDPLKHQSIIYVQSVSVDGLKLEYEIKTSSLEITECSFVWKEGYYTAILVSTNRRDQQSEILSLRLADGRLELTARLPGLMGTDTSSHKSRLLIAARLQLAVVSTNEGTYVVDLVDNRVVQSLRHHQSPPTLLWV